MLCGSEASVGRFNIHSQTNCREKNIIIVNKIAPLIQSTIALAYYVFLKSFIALVNVYLTNDCLHTTTDQVDQVNLQNFTFFLKSLVFLPSPIQRDIDEFQTGSDQGAAQGILPHQQ